MHCKDCEHWQGPYNDFRGNPIGDCYQLMRLDMAVPNGYEYDNEITTKPEFGCVLFSQVGRKTEMTDRERLAIAADALVTIAMDWGILGDVARSALDQTGIPHKWSPQVGRKPDEKQNETRQVIDT